MTPARGALLVAAVALARGLLVAWVIPPFHGVDEPAHFDYAQRLLEARALPEPTAGCDELSPEVKAAVVALVEPINFRPERPFPDATGLRMPDPRLASSRATHGCTAVAFYPPLYYASAAAAMAPVRTAPLFTRLLAARSSSVLWGALAAVAACFGGIWLFGTVVAGVQLGLLVALQPMLSFLFSVVNSDAALFAGCSISLAGMAAVHTGQRRARGLLAVAGGALIAALSKPTLLPMLPCLFVLALAALGFRSRWNALRAAIALTPAAATGLAWSIAAAGAGLGVPAGTPRPIGLRDFLADFVFDRQRLAFLWHRTYWMAWGWADTWLGLHHYVLIGAVLAAAAACALVGWRNLQPSGRGLLAAGALGTALSVGCLYALDFLFVRRTGGGLLQGRYLLGLFPLHAAMLLTAFRAGAPRVDPGWSLVAFLVALDGASVLRALVRYHA